MHPSRWSLPIAFLGLLTVLGVTLFSESPTKTALPKGFVDLAEAIPGLRVDVRYAGQENFVGKPVTGYEAARAIATKEVATALTTAQKILQKQGYALKVFDAYRPQRAVDHFVRWTKDPRDTIKKAQYYPNVRKDALISLGYIAERSGHSRGSAVDVTLVRLDTGDEVDMGSPFDLFDPLSHALRSDLPKNAVAHRKRLREAMLAAGFKPLREEWWHFSLSKEPYPKTYFDFPIK